MWDHEADVVVVGFGGAGATAAISAAAAGAKVIVLEKNAEGGGNTRFSGGTIRTFLDMDKAADFIEALCDGTTERDVVETFVHESSKNPEWIQQMGGEIVPHQAKTRDTRRYPHSLTLAAFPSVLGAEGIGPRVRVKGGGEFAGIDLWGVLLRNVVANANIRILYAAPASRLIVDTRDEVTGVAAVSGDHEITVSAKRGVILTCGGFEYEQTMHRNYLGQSFYGLCNPGNTGDGIVMAAEIGADLWHMNGSAATFGYKYPEFPFAIRHSMPSAGFIYVDQAGTRFMDETGTDMHLMWAPAGHIDVLTLKRPRSPSYVIFDEDTRLRGAVSAIGHGKVSDVYQWSKDNSAEIKKGWIKSAGNIADLALQINMQPDRLQASVAKYNMDCVGGYDPEMGREPHTLIPLGRPPYYAMDIWPVLFNTQGGPKRNAKAQVLNVRGKPIKRLYSAGELGSLWHKNYPGAGNVSEALAFGRIAGKNAASELPLTD